MSDTGCFSSFAAQYSAPDHQLAALTTPAQPKPHQTTPNHTKPHQTTPHHTKPNQTKPNQTKPNQTKPNQTKPNQTKPNQNNNQRMATVITYLSDVERGGETAFHWEGAGGLNRAVKDWRSCEGVAFKVAPRKGDAVLFHSLDPDLKVNHRSLHGSCPVVKGEKWVATKWVSALHRWRV